jgi:hypothetical protein
VCFHVVVDKLKQFKPAHNAVSLNSFAVSNTLDTFTSCKYKNSGYELINRQILE